MILLAFVLGVLQSVTAQVTLRNDFVINGKERKIKNKGITFISINLHRHNNLNYLINGRGGHTLRIDVNAWRQPNKSYSFEEVAEKIYAPNITNGVIYSVPLFLLTAPPVRKLDFLSSRSERRMF